MKKSFIKKSIAIILLLFLASPGELSADVGNFDIIEFSNDSTTLYVKIWSLGMLKNHDLYYYTWDGKKKRKVHDVFNEIAQKRDSVSVYSELVDINLNNIASIYEIDSILYILKKSTKMSLKDLMEKYKIKDAYRGNTAGVTYTEALSNKDKKWIKNNEMVKLFNFEDYELCSMSLYGIKGKHSPTEIELLKKEIDNLLKEYKYDQFQSKLTNLLSEKILMIGFCSC